MATIKFMDARAIVREHGCTLNRTTVPGEYRVCPKGGDEASAYYTNSLVDAVETARCMDRDMKAHEAAARRFNTIAATQHAADNADATMAEVEDSVIDIGLHPDIPHGSKCAQRFVSAAECDCVKSSGSLVRVDPRPIGQFSYAGAVTRLRHIDLAEAAD